MPVWKPYRSEADYSYTLGAFPTFELMRQRPEEVIGILMHPSFAESEAAVRVGSFAAEHSVPLTVEAKAVQRLSPKENCYLIGVFSKYREAPAPDKPNVLLVNPSNMGNLGTIMRTMLGFAVHDLALLKPAADIFDPRVVRASMGALFSLRHAYYTSPEEYLAAFAGHQLYPLMLGGSYALEEAPLSEKPYSLIFGNEATGLDDSYRDLGYSLVIPHQSAIDSLNITIAAGIALESFYRRRKNHD